MKRRQSDTLWTQHWTDHVTKFPIFDSVIDGRGHRGNIISITAAAMSMMGDLRIPYDRITKLSSAVSEAPSYEDAIALVEKWFKVDRDKN